ncbi:MAG: LysR family transcriptional regulator [Planctomycetota bacterium]|jgi:LysR family hydrogen peroxide-inducible transcriptional activator
MEIRQLEYVVAVAEEKSFSRAAERLHLAQPSLSQQVKKLESELGTTLFDRLARGVVTTEAGERFVERARRILADLVDARRDAGETRDTVRGTLHVGAIPTIAPFLMPGLVRAFAKRWPDVTVHIEENVTDRLLDHVVNGELDLAITSSIADDRAVHVDTVATEPLWVLLPQDSALAEKKSVSWGTFDKQRTLVLHDDHCLSGQVTQFCRRRGSRPTIVSRGAQLATIAEMIAAGLGVSVVPEMMRAQDRSKRRVYRPFAGAMPSREICVVWSLLRYRTNAARAFEALVRERFEN